jgi:hypothetical protein
MPHGVGAIERHLESVDNVPLLVSLYTDATADSTRCMVEMFKRYGEVVLTVGAGYRAANQVKMIITALETTCSQTN